DAERTSAVSPRLRANAFLSQIGEHMKNLLQGSGTDDQLRAVSASEQSSGMFAPVRQNARRTEKMAETPSALRVGSVLPVTGDVRFQLDHVAREAWRLIALQDGDPNSPSFGCFHTAYWRDKTSEFPDARFQEAGAALGLLSLPIFDA